MPRSPKAAVLAALASVACLGLAYYLAFWVGSVRHADATLLSWAIKLEHGPAGWAATAITFCVDPVCLLILLAVVCGYGLRRGRQVEALAAFAVVAGANLTTQVLKPLLAHPRPTAVLVNQPDYNTFPSGHVTAAISIAIAAVWVAPAHLRERVAKIGTGFATAVGASVLVLEWHLPSDIVGAFFVTSAWAFAVLAAYLRFGPGLRLSTRSRRRSRAPRAAAISAE